MRSSKSSCLSVPVGRDTVMSPQRLVPALALLVTLAGCVAIPNDHDAVQVREMAALQQELVDDSAKRIAHGLAAIDQQQLAERHLSDQKRQIVQVDSQALREREALRALVGADGGALADLKPTSLPEIPHTPPSNLGFELLARRPDLQAARWRVEAPLSRVEATEAAFYPDINLAGSFGLDALSLGHLVGAGSRTYFVEPALSLPLFNSKILKGHLGSALSERNEVIADYNQSILNVLRDVSQAGAALQGVEREIRHQGHSFASSEASLRATQTELRQGLADSASLLAAQLTALQEKDKNKNLQLQQQRLLAEVSLNKALGGEYRNESAKTTAPLAQSIN